MKNKGFTLIELLAVIVILAIIAAIAKESMKSASSNFDGRYIVSNDGKGTILAFYDGSGNIFVYSPDQILANADSSYLFNLFAGTLTIDVKQLNTSNVTNMQGMFQFSKAITTIKAKNATQQQKLSASITDLKSGVRFELVEN